MEPKKAGTDTERRIARLSETRTHKARVTKAVLAVEFLLNLLVATAKMVVGLATNSLSMVGATSAKPASCVDNRRVENSTPGTRL